MPRVCVLQRKNPLQEKPVLQNEKQPPLPATRESSRKAEETQYSQKKKLLKKVKEEPLMRVKEGSQKVKIQHTQY